jgi:hypothetical protein
MQIPPELFTEKEVASILRLNPGTLRRQRCEGCREGGLPLIPYLRLGRSVRYRPEDIAAIIEGSMVGGCEYD